jgi:hypothetical protein
MEIKGLTDFQKDLLDIAEKKITQRSGKNYA